MFTLNCNGKFLLAEKPLVMGILNITNDSFYAESRLNSPEMILEKAGQMIKSILVDGTKVESMPVAVVENTNLYVNTEVAEMLGIDLPKTITDRMNK